MFGTKLWDTLYEKNKITDKKTAKRRLNLSFCNFENKKQLGS